MSRNWSLVLVVAFALGFALNSYLNHQTDSIDDIEIRDLTTLEIRPEQWQLFGDNAQPVQLFDPEDQRIRVLYFGFTHCPDVCPTSLAMLSAALNQVDEATRAHFRPIFISLDPERDDAQTAATYAQYFHPSIEGLSAPLDTTTPLAHRYGVMFQKSSLADSELQYTVDHNSYFYFVQPDGTLITKVPHALNPGPIVEAMNRIQTANRQSAPEPAPPKNSTL